MKDIVGSITGFLYPFIIVFGAYVIFNGHNTPGGGFQGGAVLATLFIGRFIVQPQNDIRAEFLHGIEQLIFGVIMLLPVLLVIRMVVTDYPVLNEPYLIAMNFLIGIKVCLGLTIVIFRFGFDDEVLQ